MPLPTIFPSTTAHYALPLLFSGQSQKEFFVNQAITVLDTLVQHAFDATLPEPPVDPSDGAVYRIAATATGDWAGKEDSIAVRIAGAWHIVSPAAGSLFYDRAANAFVLFDGVAWQSASAPTVPSGGSVIDVEARQTIAEMVEALREIGVFPHV